MYFDGEEDPHKAMLFQVFEDKVRGQNDVNSLKIVILYFINHFIMYGEMHTVRVSKLSFNLIEQERYTNYCWGKKDFDELAKNHIKEADLTIPSTPCYATLCNYGCMNVVRTSIEDLLKKLMIEFSGCLADKS